MYKKIKQIQSKADSKIDLIENRLYYQSSDLEIKSVDIDDFGNQKVHGETEGTISNIIDQEETIIFIDGSNGAPYLFSRNNTFDKIKEFQAHPFVEYHYSGLLSVYQGNSWKDNYIFGLYDLDKKTLLWNQSYRPVAPIIGKDDYVCINFDHKKFISHEVLSLNKRTGEKNWSFDTQNYGIETIEMGKKGKIIQLIGMDKENIYIWVAPFMIIGIDKNSGRKVLEIESFVQYFPVGYKLLKTVLNFVEKEKKILGFALGLYFEVDLKTLKTTVLKNFRTDEKYSKYHFSKNSFQDNLICFTAIGPKDGIQCLGVFDRNELEIVWFYEFETHYGGIKNPKIIGNYLFVQNDEGLLFIFQKQTSA